MLAGQNNWLFLDLRPDLKLLAFAAGLATLTCILFGLTPALRATRVGLSDALKSAGRSLSAGRDRFELRQLLVAAQVALALVLLVGSLLFSGSLRNLLSLNPGFERNGVLVSEIDFRRLKMPAAQRVDFKRELLQKIRAIPGVVSAGEIDLLPLDGGSSSNTVWKEGGGVSDRKVEANFASFGEGYLKTMGIRLLAGRDFNDGDRKGAPNVAIVNQRLARRLGFGIDPVGATFKREAKPSEPEQVFEIVGLVSDTKYRSLREDFQPIAFLSINQDGEPDSSAQIVTRSSLPVQQTTTAIRGILMRINPIITANFHSYATTVEEGLLRERLMATLSGFFGVLGALISAVGLYGVMSYLVAQRSNEIGVRIALGAGSGSIVALILRQAALLLVFGLAAGAVLTFALAGAAKSLLFGLKPFDLPTLALATTLLSAVAALASYLPARRASHIEPLRAIRQE
jgi:predicted permease